MTVKKKPVRDPARRAAKSTASNAILVGRAPVTQAAQRKPPAAAAASPAPARAPVGMALPGVPAAARFDAVSMLNAAAVSALPIVPVPDWSALGRHEMHIDPDMDARLQVALARQKSGAPRMPLASTESDEIAVIAKVDDLAAWEALSEVKVGVTLGGQEGDAVIVTARIPVKRIEAVRAHPFVLSMKASQSVAPALAATTKDMEVAPALLPKGTKPKGGAGVVIGIVDFGCDFAHDNLRGKDGRTRIEAIWDQSGVMSGSGTVNYGRLYRSDEINAALAHTDPYAALGYGSLQDPAFRQGSHGTHVTDIAAGNGLGSGVPGCAPEAAIIFVEASASDIAWSGPDAVKQSFGDSVQMLEAVTFIFEEAGERPCVVNLSLGTNGGPHDGTTLLEQGLDRLIRAKPNRSVVIAASNSQLDPIHTEGSVAPGASLDLRWNTLFSASGQEMEVWMPAAARLAVEVIAPDGTSLGVAEPGSNMAIGTLGNVAVFVSNRLDEPNNHDNMIGIFVAGAAGGGQWRIRLINRAAAAAQFHAWVERFDPAQSGFASPTHRYMLGSISCGHETISVGSYDAHKSARPLSAFSSHGPTRDERHKPELSAPGHAVRAARSTTRTGVRDMSGTSMAAPAVTGLVALVLAEAKRLKIGLSSAELREVLIKSSVSTPPSIAKGQWDPGYGFGRASSAALTLLQKLKGKAGTGPIGVIVAAKSSKPAKLPKLPKTAKSPGADKPPLA